MALPHGYDVLTWDDKQVGKIVGESDAYYVIACKGLLRRSYRAVPKRLASLNDEERVAVLTVSKSQVLLSPIARKDHEVDASRHREFWGDD